MAWGQGQGPFSLTVFERQDTQSPREWWAMGHSTATYLPVIAALVFAIVTSSSAAEWGWAFLGRPSQPRRSSLKTETKRMLLNVSANWPLVNAECAGHAAAKTRPAPPLATEAAPDEEEAAAAEAISASGSSEDTEPHASGVQEAWGEAPQGEDNEPAADDLDLGFPE